MPLTSAEWLEAHHEAKLGERRAFAEMLAAGQPQRVIDLGCGSGLWLELFDDLLPADCELIGIDTDERVLDLAKQRSRSWERPTRFECVDIDSEPSAIPPADLTLAFNIFPYLANPAGLLSTIACNGGALAVRQYDGGALRFGPMDTHLRSSIESSLRSAIVANDQFRHYDLDRVIELLSTSTFGTRELGFELFARTSPFPKDFLAYYEGMLGWTLDLLSGRAAEALRSWLAEREEAARARYFYEVDLVAVLS